MRLRARPRVSSAVAVGHHAFRRGRRRPPARRRGRTGRGTSPRASARGSRSRAARTPRRPDDRVDRARDAQLERVVGRDDVGHAGQRRESGGRDLAREPQLHLVVGEVAQGARRWSTLTSRPSRMIADAVAGLLDLAEHVAREEDRAALARRPRGSSSKKDCWTSGSRPEVGSSSISSSGRCWSAIDEPDLLLVALASTP